jgi:hypothetical protein
MLLNLTVSPNFANAVDAEDWKKENGGTLRRIEDEVCRKIQSESVKVCALKAIQHARSRCDVVWWPTCSDEVADTCAVTSHHQGPRTLCVAKH